MLEAASAVQSLDIKEIDPVRLDRDRGKASKEQDSPAKARDRSVKARETSQTQIEHIARKLDKYVKSMQRDLKIQIHQGTGNIMVKVISSEDGKVIREVPPEELLNLAAKMEQMVGALLNMNA